MPVAEAGRVWDALMMDGNVTPAGYYALDALRIEKGYRAWGRELTPDDTPLEAGLGFTVRLDRDDRFVGTLTSAAQGHALGRPVAIGYVGCEPGAAPAVLLDGRYEIDVAGVRVSATPSLRAWHDPTGARMRM